MSRDPLNKSTDLKSQIEDYRNRYGNYPESVHADKIYRTMENLRYCKKGNIRIIGPKLGRPYKETEENKKLLRELRNRQPAHEVIRSEVEGKFRVAKRRYSLGLIRAKLRAICETSIMLVFLMINLESILREKFRLLFAFIIFMLGKCVGRLQSLSLMRMVWVV